MHGQWAGVFPIRGSPPVAPLVKYGLAIDHGDPTGCKDPNGVVLLIGQRGVGRVGRCDIGAYEYNPGTDPFFYIWFSMIDRR